MTAEIVSFPCRYVLSDGTPCKRATRLGMTRCDEHVLHLFRRDPVDRHEPEWVRRRRTIGLPAKDYSGSAA